MYKEVVHVCLLSFLSAASFVSGMESYGLWLKTSDDVNLFLNGKVLMSCEKLKYFKLRRRSSCFDKPLKVPFTEEKIDIFIHALYNENLYNQKMDYENSFNVFMSVAEKFGAYVPYVYFFNKYVCCPDVEKSHILPLLKQLTDNQDANCMLSALVAMRYKNDSSSFVHEVTPYQMQEKGSLLYRYAKYIPDIDTSIRLSRDFSCVMPEKAANNNERVEIVNSVGETIYNHCSEGYGCFVIKKDNYIGLVTCGDECSHNCTESKSLLLRYDPIEGAVYEVFTGVKGAIESMNGNGWIALKKAESPHFYEDLSVHVYNNKGKKLATLPIDYPIGGNDINFSENGQRITVYRVRDNRSNCYNDNRPSSYVEFSLYNQEELNSCNTLLDNSNIVQYAFLDTLCFQAHESETNKKLSLSAQRLFNTIFNSFERNDKNFVANVLQLEQ